MAQVPYSPVPDVGPSGQGVRNLGIDVPQGAFGENIGKAIGHLGAVLEHSGDELFKTAMAMQEQKNQAEANEADAQYSLGLTDLHVKFANRVGKDASDNLMGYKDEVDGLRKKIRDGLSSDAVRRMYDRHALNSMVIAVRGGATHAASQLKQYDAAQSKAVIDQAYQRVYDNPNDPIEDVEAKVHQEIRRTNNAIYKWPEAQLAVELRKGTNNVWSARIEGLANEKPEEAQKLLNIALSQNKLWGDTGQKLQEHIDRKLTEVGTRNIAHTIVSDPSVTKGEAIEKARELAEEQRPGNVVYKDQAVQRTVAQYEQNKSVKREDERVAMETVNEGIMNEKVRNVDDLLQIPGMEKAIKGTPGSFKQSIQRKINSYQAALKKPIREDLMEWVVSKRIFAPEEFLAIDPTTLDLSASQMNQIGKWQKQDTKVPHDNPIVKKAIGWLRESMPAQLQAMDVYSRKETNKDVFDNFAGAIWSATEIWKEEKGKYPGPEAIIKTIGPMVLRQQQTKYLGGWWTVTTEQAVFNKVPTQEFINDYIKMELATGRPDEPSVAEYTQAYHKHLLYQMGKEELKRQQKVKGEGGAVPVSK